ncbi:unnamed protein product, partial [Prorocentrum cordatum]
MAFLVEEVRALVSAAKQVAFAGADVHKATAWVEFVASVHESPTQTHLLIFYSSTVRALADTIGSRIRAKSQQEASGSQVNSASAADKIAQATAEWAKVQKAKAEREAKRGTLNYDLKARIRDVGLQQVQGDLMPSGETLLRMEAPLSARAAKERGRKWIGSSEGEDLLVNFRLWLSKTPKFDFVVGEGSIDGKVREAWEAKRARTVEERIGFTGFANFLGRLRDWGVKMILAKLARALGQGEGDQLDVLLCKLDRDTAEDAERKVSQRAEEVGQASGNEPATGGASGSAGAGWKGGKGPSPSPQGGGKGESKGGETGPKGSMAPKSP